jgi:hypothetical protein
MQLTLISRDGFTTLPDRTEKFYLGDELYYFVEYAGNHVTDVEFDKIIALNSSYHPELAEDKEDFGNRVSLDYVLPIMDSKDMDQIFYSRYSAIRYWLYTGFRENEIVKVVGENFYRIPFNLEKRENTEWIFNDGYFMRCLHCDPDPIALILEGMCKKTDFIMKWFSSDPDQLPDLPS